MLRLQQAAGNRATQRLVAPGADPASIQRRLTVNGVIIQQNNLKEELAKDPVHKATQPHVAYKYQEWANDSTERNRTSWTVALAEANAEIARDQIVYAALLDLAQTPRRDWVAAANTSPGANNARSVLTAVEGAQQRYLGACKPAQNNVFQFANVDFFVDHDANYIYPKLVVDRKGVLADKPTWATDRGLADTYSYPKNPLPRSTVVEILTAFATPGGEATMDFDQTALCLFLASFVAEPGRNPVANVTNLMIYAGWLDRDTKGTAESNVFDVMPMTKGGTAKPGDKLGVYEKAMAEHRSAGSNIQVAPKASTEEIRMVMKSLDATSLGQIDTFIAAGHQAQAITAVREKIRVSSLSGASRFGEPPPKKTK